MPQTDSIPHVEDAIRAIDKVARLAAEAEVLDEMQEAIDSLRSEVDDLQAQTAAPVIAPQAKTRTAPRQRARSGGRGGGQANRTRGTVSVLDAIYQVLESAGEPMHTKQIVAKVMGTKGVKLSGKTPEATVAARLATENAKGRSGFVKRTAPGTYQLRAGARRRTPAS